MITADANLAFGLVCLKTGDIGSCVEHLHKAQNTFHHIQGEFDFKTKEVDNLLRAIEQINQQQH